jgi:hypothetical protein
VYNSKRLIVAAIALVTMQPLVSSGAEILSQDRSLQAIVDAADQNPLAGDEVSDFKHAPGFGAFDASASISLPFNDNLASATSTQTTQIDTTALRIFGNGGIASQSNTRFDSADIAGGAFVNTQAYSGLTATFKLNNTGKVRLALNLQTAMAVLDASGVPVAGARIQTTTGAVLWSQTISATNSSTFAGDVPLAAGSYQIIVSAGANVSDGKIGSRLVDASATFNIDATIVEDSGVPPRKKKR